MLIYSLPGQESIEPFAPEDEPTLEIKLSNRSVSAIIGIK